MTPAPFSNGLSLKEAELLALLAEEASEIVKIAMKILRHGLHSYHPITKQNNYDELCFELGDLWAARRMLVTECGWHGIDDKRVNAAAMEKLLRVGRWLHHTQMPTFNEEGTDAVEEIDRRYGPMEG